MADSTHGNKRINVCGELVTKKETMKNFLREYTQATYGERTWTRVVVVRQCDNGTYTPTGTDRSNIEMYMADLLVAKLEDGNYEVIKDRGGDRVGKIMTEEELFLEKL